MPINPYLSPPINCYSIENLKSYCQGIVEFTRAEIDVLEHFFEPQSLKKKQYLLAVDQVCDFIAFVSKGCIRHYHIKDGDEVTCDVSFENQFLTDFSSFNSGLGSRMTFQALEDTTLFVISKSRLHDLYQINPKFEGLARKIAEQVAIRSTEIAMSLAADSPEERYINLLNEKPAIFQRVQQKYIAHMLGIKPESLSRIRKRVLTSHKS